MFSNFQTFLLLLILLCLFLVLAAFLINHGMLTSIPVQSASIPSAHFYQKICKLSLFSKISMVRSTFRELSQYLPQGSFEVMLIYYEPLLALEDFLSSQDCCIGARLQISSNSILGIQNQIGGFELFKLPGISKTDMALFPIFSMVSSYFHAFKVTKALVNESFHNQTSPECFVEIYSATNKGEIYKVETHSLHGKSIGAINTWCYAKHYKKVKQPFSLDYLKNVMNPKSSPGSFY